MTEVDVDFHLNSAGKKTGALEYPSPGITQENYRTFEELETVVTTFDANCRNKNLAAGSVETTKHKIRPSLM